MKQHQSGFSVLIVIIVLLVLAGVATSGVIVLRHNGEKPVSSPVSTRQTSVKSNDSALQKHCDSYLKLCFSYPKEWLVATTPNQDVKSSDDVIVTNPQKTVSVKFTANRGSIGGDCNPQTCFLKTLAMTPLTDTNLQITVVKGLYTDKEDGRWSPIYELDSQEHITAIGLQLNTMVDIGYSPAAFLEDHPHASFAVTYGDNETHWNGFDTEAEATAWLNRPEVQTAGKILESTSDL